MRPNSFQITLIILALVQCASLQPKVYAGEEELHPPKPSQFEASLGIVQPQMTDEAPFLTLILKNISDSNIAIPRSWINSEWDIVKIFQNGKELGSLSPFSQLPTADRKPALLLTPDSTIILILGISHHIDFDLKKNRGKFKARWVHHPSAEVAFSISKEGNIYFE